MNDTHSMRSADKNARATDRLALLHALAFTALRLCTAQLDTFTARLESALAAQAGNAAGESEAALFRAACAHLRGDGATFRRLFSDCLEQGLVQAVQEAAAHAAGAIESGAMDLSLITFEAMERKVIIDNISQAIDRAGADQLAVLNLRIAHWLGTGEIGSAHHPFRSAVFLKAASQAWEMFDPEGGAHSLVLREMQPEVFLPLAAVWQALNRKLASRNVLPDAEWIYRKREAMPDRLPQPVGVDMVRQWLAPQGTHDTNEARAGRLLDAMFAQLARDEAMPDALRALVGTMQPAIRKAVLADPGHAAFFLDPQCPLRRVLESCIAAGLGCASAAASDPLWRELEVASTLLASADLAHHAALADRFDALAARAKKVDDTRLRTVVAAAVEEENASQAEHRAQQDILARIEGGEVDDFLECFLQTHWRRVLVYAYGVRHARPDVLEKTLAAMDDLLWSVAPKRNAAEREAAAERLPALLSELHAWLNVLQWEGPEREAFFGELAARHAAGMRDAGDSSRRALESRMDAVQRASEHQLDRRAQEQQEAEIAPFLHVVDGLDPRTWCVFVRNDGSRINCVLSWISPARTRFIFAGQRGQLLFTLERHALAQALRAERVVPIPHRGVVGRALSSALRELGMA